MLDKQYKSLTLRLGFALLLMLVLLQGLMTALAFAQLLFEAFLIEKAANILYWSLYNLFYMLSFMLPVPFFMLISGKKKGEPIHFEVRFPRPFALMALSAVGLTLAAGQINSLLLAPFTGEDSSTDVLLEMISPDKGYMVVLVFIMIVIVPAFCEEFLFRGLILGNLLPYGKTLAIVGSALMFATMHQNFGQFLYTAVAGVFLGILYAESRSIWPSTIVHMLNNLLSFVQMIVFARIADELTASRVVLCMDLAVIGLGIASAAVLMLLSRRKSKQKMQSWGMFGRIDLPDRGGEIPAGVAVRKFFSPTVIAFIALSFLLALGNLLLENLLV